MLQLFNTANKQTQKRLKMPYIRRSVYDDLCNRKRGGETSEEFRIAYDKLHHDYQSLQRRFVGVKKKNKEMKEYVEAAEAKLFEAADSLKAKNTKIKKLRHKMKELEKKDEN